MLEAINFAWTWLATANAVSPYALLTFIAYGAIYSWRKLHPRSWLWLESRLPWAAEFSKGEEIAKNIALSLPSILITGLLAALATGANPVATAIGLLAGAASPLLHHVRKALPFDPYRGAVAEVKPKSFRTTPLTLLCLVLSLTGCASLFESQGMPCDAHDHAAQADLAANAARSKFERKACGADEECIQTVLEARDKYVDTRCALPKEGS